MSSLYELIRHGVNWFRNLVMLGLMLTVAYAVGIGPVSQSVMLGRGIEPLPDWCYDFYEPLFEMRRIPVLGAAIESYFDLWNVPTFLPWSRLRIESSGPSLRLLDETDKEL